MATSITITADTIEEARAALGVAVVPMVPEHVTEATNDLLADLKEAEFEQKAVAKERDEARAALLFAEQAREDLRTTCDSMDEKLGAIAAVVGWRSVSEQGPLVDFVRLMMERVAKTIADAGAETTRLRDENKAQTLEIKRLNDLLGVDKAYPVATVPTTGKQPLAVGTQVWIGEVGSAEPGTVAEWRVEDGGSFAYAVALDGKPSPVWVCDGDGDFHLERPKRKRRTKAEMDAERDAMNTLTPGTVMLATIDGEQVQASIVRRFEGTTKYEVEVLRDGAGLAVVEADQLQPLLDLPAEHSFPEQPVSDGPHDDPLVDDEQYAEVKTAFQALGLSVAEVKAITRQHFGTESGRELRVSQARALVDTILPGSVKVPEALPF